jgi:hypothetical protein
MQFKPFPPKTLKATQADITALEDLLGRLGWEELMYRLGVIIARQAEETTGPHKGALEAAASLVNLWGPSFYLMEMQQLRKRQE